MMSHRILPAALLLCTLAAACGDLPTQSGTQAQPAGPAYDGGGFTIDSGNSGVTGYTTGPGSGVPVGDDATTTQSGETTERGGYTMGSGG
jgi:hypothetical protein